MKYRWFIMGILCVVLLLAGIRLLPTRNPVYNGKRLSQWMEQLDFSRPNSERERAQEALQSAGPLALPLIESMLQTRTRKFEADAIRFYQKKLGRRWPFETAEMKHALAGHACYVLGTNALPVLPALIDCAISNQGSPSESIIYRAVQGFGPAATPLLIERTTSKDPTVRQKAASLLGAIDSPSPEAVKTMFDLLKDSDQTVRFAAAFAIRSFARERDAAVLFDLDVLNNLLTERDQKLRIAAAGALTYLGGDAAATVPNLLPLLSDGNSGVRKAGVEALGKIAPGSSHEARAVERLLEARNDADAMLRQNFYWSLGFFPNQARTVLPILVDGLTNSDPFIVEGCLFGLHRLGPVAQAAIPRLERMATHEKYGGLARRALKELERQPPYIKDPLNHPNGTNSSGRSRLMPLLPATLY